METTGRARRTRLPACAAMVALMLMLVTCADSGCNEEPYDPTSAAAKIKEGGLSVPVVAGDDYVKANLTFSQVRVNAYDRDGKKTIKAYCDANRISDVDRHTETEEVELELRFRFVRGGKTLVNVTRTSDFEDERVLLNELCQGGLAIPDEIVVTKIRVQRSKIPPPEPAEPEPEDR